MHAECRERLCGCVRMRVGARGAELAAQSWHAAHTGRLPSGGAPTRARLQAEAERQAKIKEEVTHELRMFYCEVGGWQEKLLWIRRVG